LYWIFGTDRLTPYTTHCVEAVELAPPILIVTVIVSSTLVNDIEVVHILIVAPVLGELRSRVYLVSLPVGTVLPPLIALGVLAQDIVEAMSLSQVGTHQILECMTNLMSYGDIAASCPSVTMEESYFM
jgi:hypothetical protein